MNIENNCTLVLQYFAYPKIQMQKNSFNRPLQATPPATTRQVAQAAKNAKFPFADARSRRRDDRSIIKIKGGPRQKKRAYQLIILHSEYIRGAKQFQFLSRFLHGFCFIVLQLKEVPKIKSA